jgi:two-component system, response regulator RegA
LHKDFVEKSLLILDDDEAYRKTLSLEFSERGYTVFSVSTVEEVRFSLDSGTRFDFAILDLRLKNELSLLIIGE